ncbi:MAG: hypothetical protein SPJ01_05805 [Butyricicoccus sp.]|nr:hypothetical protein [Butyricicoccus pullicaecorum]MCI6720122.1 hypothetical protein [Clostridiales bacterium]MDY5972365.1 hypothetical protein [Butyricicoccus sp.]
MATTLLALLFAAFLVCAALTAFFQFRYGSLTGPKSESAQLGEESPAARKCRRRAVFCAVCAGVFLVAALATGATLR